MTEAVQKVLTAHGYAVEQAQLGGGAVLVGRRKDFRVRWMLTQLKTTVVVADTGHLTLEVWSGFLGEAFRLAAAFKGGLPNGLQSGAGMVAVMSCNTIDPAAAEAARRPAPKEWFTGIGVAAAVVRGTGEVHTHDERQLVGRVYLPHLRGARDLVVEALR